LMVYIFTAVLFALLITAPIIAYEVYKFVDPALYPNERRAIYPFIISFVGLFWVGVLFGFFFMTPLIFITMVPFFGVIGGLPIISVREFYQVILVTAFASGMVFTFPTVFVLLVRFGIIKTQLISKNRAYFYAGLFIITAIATPDGGPVADLILFVPAVILVEASLIIGKYFERKRIKEQGIPVKTEQGVPVKVCKFCQRQMAQDEIFCPHCGKANE